MQGRSAFGRGVAVSLLAISGLTAGCMSRNKMGSTTNDLSGTCGANSAPANYQASTGAATVIPMQAPLSNNSVVIYYAIDTREAFMQAAVDEDIRALRASCELTADPQKKARINWIAFVNSHFIDGTPSYLRCKAGEFKEESFSDTFNADLQPVLDKITNPATYSASGADLAATKVQGYKDFPFADYRVLRAMLKHARTVFPADSHVYHLHIKSHGSAKLALTGLTETQWKKKDDCQKAVLAEKGLTLPEISLGNAGLSRTEEGQPQMLGEEGQVYLGEEGQAVLGEEGQAVLGDEDQPLLGTDGQTVLGDDDIGLGADTHFGSSVNNVIAEVTNFLLVNPNTRIGYLILEGCYSAGGQSFLAAATNLGGVLLEERMSRIYAASGSLWYRNFDWSRIYAQWLTQDPSANTKQLIDVIDQRSLQVKNWKKMP